MPLLLFALDIDAPTEQLRREAYVLPLLSNGERELGVIHDDFHMLAQRVYDRNPADLGRAQRMRRENHRIIRILDDIDFLATQLADNGLHTHALHAHASAHAVHIPVPALYCNLGPLAGFPGTAFDHNGAVVDFGNFLLEQPHHQLRRRSRDHYSGTLTGFVHGFDDAPHAVAHAVVFQPRLLLLWKPRLGFSKIQDQISAFDSLDGAVHQLAYTPGVFLINGLSLGLADLLKDHLLGGLGGDASQQIRRLGDADFRFQFGCRIDLASLRQGELQSRILNGFHDFLNYEQIDRAGLLVQLGDVVFVGPIVLSRRHQKRVLHRIQHTRWIDKSTP